ncbi:hypothetical protein [Nocardioides sp.]|uniref:hypothetical protein n=1 Tax=Nocardioides sp. TaxID=35761 RepID=UPI0027331D02|nr:hypothetical protein [Nocardioides sp.]MDP3892242.1 hypothetical protein [Nocardioides sp.]
MTPHRDNPAPAREAEQAPNRPSRRRLRLLIGLMTLAVLAGMVALGWVWRHPTAFGEAGGWGVSNSSWPLGTTLYVGMTYEPPEATGEVVVRSAQPRVPLDSADSGIAFFVCTVDSSAGVGAVGTVGESDIQEECSSLRPAEGASLTLNATPREQLVMAVTPHQRGRLTVRGVDLTYSHGWQRGAQLIGGEVELESHG